MKIVLFGRTDKGGMKTHIYSLRDGLSKNHEVRILSQSDFKTLNLSSGRYYLDIAGFKKIKAALDWCDIMHVHLPSSSFELLIPWIRSDKPIVNTFHFAVGYDNLIFNKKVRIMNKISKKLVYLLGKVYAKRSSRFIAVGSMLRDILKDLNDTVTIRNGIPIDHFRKIRAERYFKDFTIGYLGRVDPEKNVETLIRACKDLNLNLVIAGIGTEYAQLEKKYKSNKILFVGKKKYPPVEFYNSIDVFCSPSFIEGCSLTPLEALACERPVIVSGCGGDEADIHKSFGVVSLPDKESLKKSIRRIMSMDLGKMGKAGRKVVKEKFDLRLMVDKVEKVYKELV